MLQSLCLISLGAAAGASLRWGLSIWLNPLASHFAAGTLVANFLGCLLMGILLGVFWQYPQVNPAWRLFFVTGFLGALTTLSSLSGEVIELAFSDKWFYAIMVSFGHVLGSLVFTLLGLYLFRWVNFLFPF